MKTKWRQHEIIILAMFAVYFLIRLIQRDQHIGPERVYEIYGAYFKQAQVPFTYYRNVLIPSIGQGILLLAALCPERCMLINLLFYRQQIDQFDHRGCHQ